MCLHTRNNMRIHLMISLIAVMLPLMTCDAQTIHGPSVRTGYSTGEHFSYGLGYKFFQYKDDWGWERPGHSYYIEYIPRFKAIGFTANVQSTILIGKAGIEANFRTKSEMDKTYFGFFPHLGFDLVYGDLSFGPEFFTTRIEDKWVAFKVSLKVHPKFFNTGSKRLKFKKS